jgi:hypothetical protein
MPRSREDTYLVALQKARTDLQKLDPYRVAFLAGCTFTDRPQAKLILPFFGADYVVSFPDLGITAEGGLEPDIPSRLVMLHYLIHADGVPPADQWVSFRELPDGRVYDAAFQGRSPLRIAHEFGGDAAGFAAACRKLGGVAIQFGDAAYRFQLLPRVDMGVILHLGDDEFPPAVNVVFDGAAGHYLPTEDLAVLGGMLAGKLIKAGNA